MSLVDLKQGGNFGEVLPSTMLVPLLSFLMSSVLEIWKLGSWNQGMMEKKG